MSNAEHGPGAGGHEKISIVFIVNGEDVPVEANVNAPLAVAVEHALTKSHNSGRSLSDWDVRDSKGTLLEIGRKLGEFGFTNGVKLFLSLRVGAGGSGP